MGLFDYVRSSHDLGEQLTNVEMQTKGLGRFMKRYWIDPNGYLFKMEYKDTHDLIELKEGDDGYDDRVHLFNLQWIPTGKHGKIKPYYITNYVEVYPSEWDGEWESWPRLRLHFVNGKLLDVENITGQRNKNYV